MITPRGPIIPAVLTIDPETFTTRLAFAREQAKAVHIDVIDNDFCNGATLPIDQWPALEIDYVEAHLMVAKPFEYLAQLSGKGVTRAIVHVEADFDPEALLAAAKAADILLGLAVNPDTDLDRLRALCQIATYVQVMGVFPGRSGQAMVETTASAVHFLTHNFPSRLTVTVDGGVSLDNLPSLNDAGVDHVVVTHALFEDGDPTEQYQKLVEALR